MNFQQSSIYLVWRWKLYILLNDLNKSLIRLGHWGLQSTNRNNTFWKLIQYILFHHIWTIVIPDNFNPCIAIVNGIFKN